MAAPAEIKETQFDLKLENRERIITIFLIALNKLRNSSRGFYCHNHVNVRISPLWMSKLIKQTQFPDNSFTPQTKCIVT